MSDLLTLEVGLGVLLFWLGACFGSFANVIILRLPQGMSCVLPRSHCYSCKKNIHWFDNIPLVSWFILKGKCRYCEAPISKRYLIVEFIMASLFCMAYIFTGWKWLLLERLIFIFGLVVVSFIDLDHMILPDVFTLSGMLLGVLGAMILPERSVLSSLTGLIMGGGFFWSVAALYQWWRKVEGLGGGDIKLLGWIGAVLGWQSIPYVILCSSLLGSLVGFIYAAKNRSGLKTVIPFGPFLALSAISFIFGGNQVALWYLQLFFPWL